MLSENGQEWIRTGGRTRAGEEADVNQLADLWNALDLRRRVFVIGATVAMFAAVLGLARMASAPNMTLLYSGLEGSASGEVVRALEQRGVTYEVRGGAIFVDGLQRDELRMILAGEGLPRNGTQGYELLDGLSGFGTTSQMFDAAYWRAKEGELARTIAASPQIESARVHIAHSGSNPFQRDVRPTASIFVTSGGGAVTSARAKALRYLVASAVAGLSPEDVSVIDSSGELIGAEDDTPAPGNDERADVLRDRVQRLLEARVGIGNAVVEVSVDTVTETESIREHTYDPEARVAISTETEESSSSTKNSDSGGDVTVASNVPDGAAGGGGGGDSQSQQSETRERVNYEVSEVQREVVKGPGAIRRITVAALVNGIPVTAEDGTTNAEPRGAEELDQLRDLIASAVGFDETRGDAITIKSMLFQPITERGTESMGGWLANMAFDVTRLIQIGVLAVVALILGLFVVRPILSRPPVAGDRLALPGAAGDRGDAEVLTGEVSNDDFALPDLPMLGGFDGGMGGMGGLGDGASDDPVERLRALTGERQEEVVEILRGWLEDPREPA